MCQYNTDVNRPTRWKLPPRSHDPIRVRLFYLRSSRHRSNTHNVKPDFLPGLFYLLLLWLPDIAFRRQSGEYISPFDTDWETGENNKRLAGLFSSLLFSSPFVFWIKPEILSETPTLIGSSPKCRQTHTHVGIWAGALYLNKPASIERERESGDYFLFIGASQFLLLFVFLDQHTKPHLFSFLFFAHPYIRQNI